LLFYLKSNIMKTKGTILDNSSGTLGAITYSSNASGNYAKLYKKPTNPNSLAQQNQRNRFREMSGGFNSLSQAVRQGWAVFAKLGFNPLRKTNNGQYTGAMAFKALKLIVTGSNARFLPFTCTADLGTTSLTLTSLAVAMPAVAPNWSVRPDILDSTGIFYPLQILSATLSNAGALSAQFWFGGVPAAGLTAGAWTDENGTKLGFTFYISEALPAAGYRPQTPLKQNLGFTNIVQSSTPGLTGKKGFKLSASLSSLISNFKSFPAVGKVVLLTACVVGDNGTISQVGSIYVTIT
jgi:hypothetical protein